jgi:hypothetical protein
LDQPRPEFDHLQPGQFGGMNANRPVSDNQSLDLGDPRLSTRYRRDHRLVGVGGDLTGIGEEIHSCSTSTASNAAR